MTSPPTGGTLGGGGFQSGDDFIAARVSIDIPTEGISGLREITQEMDRFRTSVESANRSSETFSSYLTQIAEAANQAATAQQNLVDILQNTTDFQNRVITSGAGGVPQLNAPAQYTEHWDPSTPGMGGGIGGGNGAGGYQDINSQLEALKTQNPRAYVNKMAASGQYRSGDIPAASPSGMDIQNAAERISQRSQLTAEGEAGLGDAGMTMGIGSRAGRMGTAAQQILNEISPGGAGGMIQRGIGAMGQLGGGGVAAGLGGGLGRMAGMAGLGPVAGALGIGLAGYGLVQGAGGIYQDYKNMGSVRGGGASEGVGYEMSIRAMAMNPFISGDQSRQIIQQGLRDGYTGQEFSTVTDMVAHNLKDFNMQIGDSFNLVRKNVVEGGQSMLSLANDMGMLKDMSKTGYRSLPELQQGYAQTTSALISAGMPGSGASEAALLAGQAFKDNATLAGSYEGVAAAFSSNPQNMAIMKYQGGLNAPPGMMPGAMAMAMGGEQGGKAMMAGAEGTIKKFALQAYRARGNPPIGSTDYFNAAYMWQMRMQQMGMPFANDTTKTEQMFRAYIQGESPLADANKEVDDERKNQSQVKDRNPIGQSLGGMVSTLSAGFGSAFDTAVQIGGTVKDLVTDNSDHIGERWRESQERLGNRFAAAGMAASGQKIAALDNVARTYGANGFEVLDNNQQVVKFNPDNKDQMERLSSGEYRWRPKGSAGAGYTVEQVGTASGDDLKKIAGGKTEVSGAVTIGLTPEAQKALVVQGGNKVTLTPHEQQANAGYGQATPNNAAPGEGRR